MGDYLDELAAFGCGLRFEDLPAEVIDHARYVLADTVASIAAGAVEPEVVALSAARIGEAGAASVIGTGRRAGPETAAFLNGVAGTWLEMDEGNRFSRGHPAIHVVPAALAHAEAHGRSGRDLLVGLIWGYEVCARIGIASRLRPAMHPHGTWGTVGAAAAAARLAGTDRAGMRETINIASSLTLATSKKTMLQGGTVRNAYAGVANQLGLLAFALKQSGFTGEQDGLSSVFGAVVSDRFDAAEMTRDLGGVWQIARNYFKRHSCCRYNHGALDALDRLLAEHPVGAEEIGRIQVVTYRDAAELDDPAPRNVLAAKFSVPFALAARIATGSSGVLSFTWDRVRDEGIRALAARVSVREDPALTAMLPHYRPARIEIETGDGRRLRGSADVNRGDDQAPYTHDELTAKFYELADRAWPGEAARRVHGLLHRIETVGDLAELTESLADVRRS